MKATAATAVPKILKVNPILFHFEVRVAFKCTTSPTRAITQPIPSAIIRYSSKEPNKDIKI
jgi:hypothetical protein